MTLRVLKTYQSRYRHVSLHKERYFSNTFRFAFDLCAIKDHLEFERSFKDTYSSELQLDKENILISF